MIFLVVSLSLFAFSLTLAFFSKTIQSAAAKKQQLRWLRGDVQSLDEDLEQSIYKRFILPAWKKMIAGVSRLSKPKRTGSAKAKERELRMENELRLAGIRISLQEFMIFKVVGTMGILALSLVLALFLQVDMQLKYLIALFALILAILIPRYILKSKIKKRQTEIQNQLPNVMDVLCVSIEAGLSFDSALLKVIERFKGPLIEEFSQIHREMQMGMPRRESLTALTKRSNVEELKTFASAVIQSEQFGMPMRNVLRSQAQQLRVNRRQLAQEKGMKAPVKMTIPMVIFIFPVIFIILLGPTIMKVI